MKSGYFEPFNCTIITVLSQLSQVLHILGLRLQKKPNGYGLHSNCLSMQETHFQNGVLKHSLHHIEELLQNKLLQNIIFAPCKYFLVVR